jgi:hypothetical protein
VKAVNLARRAKVEPLLRPFKGSARIRERGSDAWFPIEFLTYQAKTDFTKNPCGGTMSVMGIFRQSSLGNYNSAVD